MNKKIKIILNVLFGNENKKYEARHTVISYFSKKAGFRLGNKNLSWHKDEEFRKIYEEFLNTGKRNKNIPERKFVLYSIAKSITNIPGDIAECGVYTGQSSYLMLYANKETEKKMYGFDSFEGLSMPSGDDNIKNTYSFKWKKNDLKVTESIARNNLSKFNGRFYLFKGWIPDRFSEVEKNKFSMIHIDVDLFQPTIDSVSFFWDRLNVGGVMVCDDYGFETCPGSRKAMDDFFSEKGYSVIHLTTGQGVIFKNR